MKVVSGSFMERDAPQVTIRNDSEKPLLLDPLEITAWYKRGGKERQNLRNPNASLGKGEFFTIPGPPTSYVGGDCVEKVRVEVGTKGASGGDIFTVSGSKPCS